MELVSAFPEAWTIEDHDDPHPSDIQASEKTRQRYVLFVKVGVEAHLQEACVVCGLCQVEMGMTQCTECGFEFCEACNLKHHARGDARHHHRVLMEAFCYPEVRTDEAQRIAERLGVKATWAGELPESFQTLSQPEYLWPEVARIGSCLKEEAITEAHGQQLCEARCDSCDRQALFMCRDCEMQQCQSCSKAPLPICEAGCVLLLFGYFNHDEVLPVFHPRCHCRSATAGGQCDFMSLAPWSGIDGQRSATSSLT